MTVSTTTTSISYNGDGSTTIFYIPFKFLANAHIVTVLRNAADEETTLVLDTDYTVTGAGNDAGELTMTTAPASGETLTISRATTISQETDYVENDPFPAAAHETALDKLTLIVQEVDTSTSLRSVRASSTVTDSPNLEFTQLAAERANKLFGFDDSGDLELLSLTTLSAAEDAAAAAASAAEAAAAAPVVQYNYSTDTNMSDPGSGVIRLNNTATASVTSMALSNTSSDTNDVSDIVATWDDITNATGGAVITFRDQSNPSVFASYYVTSVTDNTSWLLLAVTYIAGLGTPLNGNTFSLAYAITGQDGAGTLSNVVDDTSPELGGALVGLDQNVSRVNLFDYGEVINAIGSIGGGTQDIDITSGNFVTGTVDTSATTFTFSNPTASGKACAFTLRLTNGGSQTVNWPASVQWPSGTAPTLTASGVDILVFLTIDGGTTWDGVAASLDTQ